MPHWGLLFWSIGVCPSNLVGLLLCSKGNKSACSHLFFCPSSFGLALWLGGLLPCGKGSGGFRLAPAPQQFLAVILMVDSRATGCGGLHPGSGRTCSPWSGKYPFWWGKSLIFYWRLVTRPTRSSSSSWDKSSGSRGSGWGWTSGSCIQGASNIVPGRIRDRRSKDATSLHLHHIVVQNSPYWNCQAGLCPPYCTGKGLGQDSRCNWRQIFVQLAKSSQLTETTSVSSAASTFGDGLLNFIL